MHKKIANLMVKFFRKFFPISEGKTSANDIFTSESNIGRLRKEVATDDHLVPIEKLIRRYQTNIDNGLTDDEVRRRLLDLGPNRLTPPKKIPEYIKFLGQLFGGFALLLWGGAALCFAAYIAENGKNIDHLYLGIVLTLVVIMTGIFAYLQESKSSAIMETFRKLIPPKATVIRNGIKQEIYSENLVQGDIVEIRGGDRIPADIRILQAMGCKVDNSSLTGESEPQTRTPSESNKIYIESRNMSFFSTNCVEGWAKGVVVFTGDRTVMGKIANLTANLSQGESPIAKEIGHFIRLITYFAISIAVLFFLIALIIGYKVITAIVFFIGIIVANVPEGLLATLTVCLTLTAKQMAKKNCLVKNLEAVETLGSTSTICSDKTGTLTQNQMTVSHLWITNKCIEAKQLETNRYDIPFNELKHMLDIASLVLCLCSKAEFKSDQNEIPIIKRETIGDASESAILKFMETISVQSVMQVRKIFPKVCEIPFNSTNKFHLTIHEDRNKQRYFILLKGAPERVLERCSVFRLDDDFLNVRKIDSQFENDFNKIYKTLGGMGERVLGFAFQYLSPDKYPIGYEFDNEKINFPTNQFEFGGLVSMIDPPRPGVHSAVSKCRDAGIRVVMVTGDHPITAKSIAASVGIISKKSFVHDVGDIISIKTLQKSLKFHAKRSLNNTIVVTGAQMIQMTDAVLDYITRNFDEIVFARTSPQQKLAIVESFQRKGDIVAVTGDGVNDSPALKKADIGIAMGISGSDVSKQAADMILLDDNFASIVTGVEEGRIIFDNLKKSISYTLTSNVPELTPFLVYIVFGIPLPLGTITILLIDIGTDIIPAISLAFEPAESDIMQRKPRRANERLVNNRLISLAYGQIGFIQTGAGFLAYFAILGEHGFFLTDLIFIRKRWENKALNDLRDYYGQEWTYIDRKRLEYTCQTAFFIAIVVTQWFDLIACKTRRNSIIHQGMRNDVLNFSLIFETCMAIFLVYCPGMDVVLKIFPLRLFWWTFGLPYGVLIIVYDECRRFMIRNYPGGFMEQTTYY